jgi:Protein of unknown function (DUF1570)
MDHDMDCPAWIKINRRNWLRAAAGTLIFPGLVVARAGDPNEAAEVEAQAKKVGLIGFGRDQTEHYLGLGNASPTFRREAIQACELIAEAFLKHFREKGFPEMILPKQRMTVVVLADAKAYATYSGVKQDAAIGGSYELDTNRLVMFDFRSGDVPLNAAAQRINSMVLTHETTHQLTFNTGLLNRQGDAPLCVIEGMATYGEVWRPNKRGEIGQVNFDRLKGLELVRKQGAMWIPLDKLLVKDDLLEDLKTREVAYAESWLLIHYCMKSPGLMPKFQAYLAAIKPRRDASHRLEDARAHLGDLKKLDDDVRRYRTKPIGR